MLAARDQENLVHGHQQVAASKPLNQTTRGLQPKTPGNKYPKTPLRIPLNDENAPTGFGKTGKGKGLDNLVSGKKIATFDKNAFITPMAPRERAPLGAKTTNAKAKAFQTPAGPTLGKELEKSKPKQTSARRPKKVIHADTVKLEVHGDESPLTERDVEYCPPKPKELPFECDDFPDGCLNYSALKPENMMRDIYQSYYQPMLKRQAAKHDKDSQDLYDKVMKEHDEGVMKMMEEDWTVGDVPEAFRHLRKKQIQPQDKPIAKSTEQIKKPTAMSNKGPATITSRKAASALSVAPKAAPVAPKASKPAPKASFLYRSKAPVVPSLPSNTSSMRHTAATAASRSTIGYTKGRSASGALNANTFKPERSGLQRSVSNMSQGSDTTITPANFKDAEPEWKNPSFLKAFEVDDDELEPGLRGVLPESLRRMDGDEEEFVMPLPSSESK
ncbi:uncharacterized protein LY89DRAFT_659925 [Mollisia scopiformis]|uniref:Uncharacterized protein n=1 Tax=Mollisia scopiformis TaxID=149040 RepID=A0A132B5K6_MOLSC|nr:uncharacterized protein LY89DRAFT_659925 [Mollisia scopiformis]KUJ07690.1 hypothetical protein LY89DRAFT_659925 [Mollisia scopiformis]